MMYNKKNWVKQLKQNGNRLLLLGLILLLCFQKDINFQFQLSTGSQLAKAMKTTEAVPTEAEQERKSVTATNLNLGAGLLTVFKGEKPVVASTSKTSANSQLANTYSNMTYTRPKAAKVMDEATLLKRKKQLTYVKRFAHVAQAEMKKFGIPSSITLAQGLIESNAGASRLARQNNNHFGMKCFSRKCSKNHCSNFTDDSHKDFFVKYGTAWDSYRSHSLMLKKNKRYRSLFKIDQGDYRAWAKGLKRAGYATDKAYAEKLIFVIEELNLTAYD